MQVGKGGLKGGSDDYRSVTLDLQANNLNLSQFYGQKFGVRLQSVGPESNRNGSSKLEGDVPQPIDVPTPPIEIVPEPNTLAGIFLSCLGLLGLRYKKK